MEKAREAKLRSEHGPLVIVTVAGVECAFKTPSETDYEEMTQGLLKASGDKAKIGPVFRQYCLAALVEPDADQVAEAFRKQPAAASRIADKLSDLAGADIEIAVKKG